MEEHVFAHMPEAASVSRNPWLFDIREELKSWDDVPRDILDEALYLAEFDLDGDLLWLHVTREYVGVEHICRGDCWRADEDADQDVVNLISPLCSLSKMAVIGYEISVCIEDVEEEINALSADKSWRPLLVKKEGLSPEQQICGFTVFRNGDSPSVPEKNIVRYLKNVCRCGGDSSPVFSARGSE